jgi:predicted nucleic acid-binding protein
MALVVDTGVIYAALDENDADHSNCFELLSSEKEQLVVPAPVLVELDYFIGKNASVDAWVVFCEDLAAGAYTVFSIDAGLAVQCARLQATYADSNLGFVDASVFITCEVLGEDRVATLDRRHFGMLRTSKDKSLRILPA